MYAVCAMPSVGVILIVCLCTDRHLPVCGGVKHRILVLYYSMFLYASAYAIAPMWLLPLSIDFCFIYSLMVFYGIYCFWVCFLELRELDFDETEL